MTNATVILNAIELNDTGAADKPVPLVCEESCRLSARKMCEKHRKKNAMTQGKDGNALEVIDRR